MRWLGAGLFLLTLATLLVETLDARLLSVLTWYHLSFFAVSLAMLGMAAGAVFVFLHPSPFARDDARRSLSRVTLWFAMAVPISHVMTLSIPFPALASRSVMEVLSVAVSTAVLGVPFVLSGVAVTTALTRCGGAVSRLYAFDLLGAAAGCALVVPLLERTNVSSAILIAGASAAAAAVCFSRFARDSRTRRAAALAVALAVLAIANTGPYEALQIAYPKNRQLWRTNSLNAVTRWNSHSYVLVQRPREEAAFMWGPGRGAERFRSRIAWLAIDGEAGTPITEWHGDPSALEWVSYDVTSLPYHLRQGAVAVVGVGGGRDVLSAIWGRNAPIVGVDVNRIMIELLEHTYRDFAGIAARPDVTLVHDDGRAYLTRTDRRFDVIQMSLVDTWAATGAGAFTLSENGLYTLEAWRVFLDRLTADGVLSVSRWFDPANASETSRLVSLGVAALLDRGVARPLDHLLLVVRDRVATMMVGVAPFTADDRRRIDRVAAARDFHVAIAPWQERTASPLLHAISRSATWADLDRATTDPVYDLTPPTDRRPYYFNMLRPRALFDAGLRNRGGAIGGNLQATLLLLALLGISTVLVALIVVWPLVSAGRPAMSDTRFAVAMTYFAAIGAGYMLIQIGLLQRLAVYIGHPTYTLAIVLFSMLLFTGLGSLLSQRLPLSGRELVPWIPIAIAVAVVAVVLALPPVLAATVTSGLAVRTACVLACAAPLSMLLGICFPLGVRLLEPAAGITPWVWGVNGAFSVLASIAGVAISMWIAIDANFWIAAAIYAGLTVPLRALSGGRDAAIFRTAS
jgi:hypothetical protein